MNNTCVVGIDPGQSGGITFHYGYDHVITAYSMPETLKDICNFFEDETLIRMAFIEEVHSMPKQGVSSSFKFGKNYGSLLGILAASEVPYTLLTPHTWQKALRCLTGGDKNVSKARAQQLFPNIKVTHAIADSLLIAEYGWRQVNNLPFDSTPSVLASSRKKKDRASLDRL